MSPRLRCVCGGCGCGGMRWGWQATSGSSRLLQRIGLLVAGSTPDGRGFLASAASASQLFLRQWPLSTDRPVRSLHSAGSTGGIFAAGTGATPHPATRWSRRQKSDADEEGARSKAKGERRKACVWRRCRASIVYGRCRPAPAL